MLAKSLGHRNAYYNRRDAVTLTSFQRGSIVTGACRRKLRAHAHGESKPEYSVASTAPSVYRKTETPPGIEPGITHWRCIALAIWLRGLGKKKAHVGTHTDMGFCLFKRELTALPAPDINPFIVPSSLADRASCSAKATIANPFGPRLFPAVWARFGLRTAHSTNGWLVRKRRLQSHGILTIRPRSDYAIGNRCLAIVEWWPARMFAHPRSAATELTCHWHSGHMFSRFSRDSRIDTRCCAIQRSPASKEAIR